MRNEFVHLNSIVHANPCTEDWDRMPGDEWTRHCDKCGQNVYNLSAMTAREAEALLERHEGRVCTKLYRRPDGSVLTQRCPSSIRRGLLRIGKWAAAAGFAIPALAHEGMACPRSKAEIRRRRSEEELSTIEGTVFDPSGYAVIPGARVDIRNENGFRRSVTTNPTGSRTGSFRIPDFAPGIYTVETSMEGFSSLRMDDVKIEAFELLEFRITLWIAEIGGNA